MLQSQKLALRASEIRARLNALGGEELTDETRSELDTLTGEYRDVESKDTRRACSQKTFRLRHRR